MDYNEIIEMEVLNGIDRVFHSIMSSGNVAHYKHCGEVADRLKAILPEYIDNQCDVLGRKSEYMDFMKEVQKQNPNVPNKLDKAIQYAISGKLPDIDTVTVEYTREEEPGAYSTNHIEVSDLQGLADFLITLTKSDKKISNIKLSGRVNN